MSSQVTGVGVSGEGEFGANEWLVDELYEQFKLDKNSVDKAWWPILEAYQPVDTTAPAGEGSAPPSPSGSAAAAAPQAAAPQAASAAPAAPAAGAGSAAGTEVLLPALGESV
uniref:2-oxoglutarate dehydrogenase E1 subunit family protein n=1 Tax=uncultured Microbacterium sp. TaxID=191216 RepID=UPI0028D0A1C7